jgi:hypothetical protein
MAAEARGMNLVYIYGPPATGKLTVANALVAQTGYKVFHNHLSIDCIRPVFDFGTESFWRLVHQIRLMTIEESARSGTDLIYTSVYSHPNNQELLERRLDVVERHGGRVCLVQLLCSDAARESRLSGASRLELNKITSIEVMRQMMNEGDLLSPVPGRPSLVIDNTDLEPEQVANRVIDHFGMLRLPRALE